MISININPAASGAGLNLGNANDALQKSLARLSSGQRIVNSSDDAGGLAVSMKMSAALKRTEATAINLRNVVSYLDTQDGAFKIADKVISRMSELTTLARDVTKNAGDIENYDKEFQNLQDQLISLGTEKFNGISLFDVTTGTAGSSFLVPTSEDGTQNTSVTKAALGSDPWIRMLIEGFTVSGNEFTTVGTGSTLTVYADESHAGSSVAGTLEYDNSAAFAYVSRMALQSLADMRAQNGAEMSRVNFAQDLLEINANNLEAANSRIIDVDVAAESSQLARFQILQQAGTAMLAQANTSQQSLVRLLQG